MHGHQPGFAELGVADSDNAGFEIDIAEIEVQHFTDPHSGDADEPIHCVAAETVEWRCTAPFVQARCKDALDFFSGEDVRLERISSAR